MFTGIVEAVGRIAAATPQGDGLRLRVDPGGLDVADVGLGDSVAVNGCCLTVVAKDAGADGARLAFDVSGETLRCTAGLDGTADVNLEKALRLADRLGGHLMTGHVDGVGTVVAFAQVAKMGSGPISLSDPAADSEMGPDPIFLSDPAADTSWRLEVEAPPDLARFIAAKGSIAVQGVSLTVNGVDGARFHVNLIPHTLAVTTLKDLAPGARVNIEVDLIARYVERLRSPG
jgi:riboflavin synthase